MYVVKTALRESFYNRYVGFRDCNYYEDVKIETDLGKIVR